MLYVQQNTELPVKEFRYNANANKFFSNYYEKNLQKRKKQMKENYDENSEKIKNQRK